MIQIVRAALGLVFLAAAAVFVLGIANGFGALELALVAGLAVAALVAFGRLGERRSGPLRTPR